MKRTALLLALFMAAPLTAQDAATFSVGGAAGIGIPTGDLADENASTGFAFDINGTIHFTPVAGVYARFMRASFSVDTGEPDVDGDFIDSGFALGGQLNVPMQSDGPVRPWLQAGILYNVLKVEGSSGDFTASVESDRTLGFEVGAGFDYAVGDAGLLLQPAIHYRSYEPEFEGESNGTASYVVIRVGLAYAFGGY